MKRLLGALLALFLLCAPAWSANTSTLIDTIPATGNKASQLYEYTVAIDTTASDIDIRTPTNGNRVYVVGMKFTSGTSGTVTFKSGATAAKTQVVDALNRQGLVYTTKADEKLTIQTSAATTITLYLYEGKELEVDDIGLSMAEGGASSGGGGAGTEYTEGDTDASITGGAILWEDAGNTLTPVNTSKPLPTVQTGSLPAGTAYIGKVRLTDGTTDAVVDTAGNQAIALRVPGSVNPVSVDALGGDALSNASNRLSVASHLRGYNGSTWDRIRSNTDFSLNVNAPATTLGGATVFRNLSFTEVNVKASAGKLYSINFFNTNASTRYLQFYNNAGTPVNGTTAVYATYVLAGFDNKTIQLGDVGGDFATGIGMGCTTDAAGTTDATAGDCGVGALWYK